MSAEYYVITFDEARKPVLYEFDNEVDAHEAADEESAESGRPALVVRKLREYHEGAAVLTSADMARYNGVQAGRDFPFTL